MTDRPILFNGAMVRAILAGQKTQTRRVVKPAHAEAFDFMGGSAEEPNDIGLNWAAATNDDGKLGKPQWLVHCADYPEEGVIEVSAGYGAVGDRLWIRETWQAFEHGMDVYPYIPKHRPSGAGLLYAASDCDSMGWRPSIHMPRWASRITLEIIGVRVERLQAISEEDARAEGVHGPEDDVADNLPNCPQCGGVGVYTAFNPATGGALPDTDCERCDTPKKRFRLLWSSINGAESWDANPWVWAIEFRKVAP